MLLPRANPLLRRGTAAGLAVLPLAGLLMIVQPALALAVLAAGFLIFAFEAPLSAVGLFLFAHVATPPYVRVPLPGGLATPPISTGLLLALVAIGVLAYLGRAPLPRAPGPGGQRLAGFWIVFALIAASSLIDPRTGAEGLGMWVKVFLLPAAALVAILCTCRGPEDVARLSLFLMAGGVVASLYAVVEYGLGRNPLLDMYIGEIDIRYHTSDVLGDIAYRCFSVYSNPIEFALVMGMIFPFAAVRMAVAERVREKLAYALVAGILAIGIALTFSRGPMLALIVGSVLTGIIYRQLRPWLAAAVIAAAIVLMLAWPFVGAGISDRISDVDNMTLRFKLWQTALAIFMDNPLRGIGIGNFPEYYLEAARENHIGPFYEFGAGAVVKIRVAENAYLQLAAEMGIIGAVAGIAAVLAMLALSVSLARRASSPRSRHLATAVAISIVVYAINGMFVTAYTFYFATLLLTGFLPGCLLVLDRAEARRAGASPAAREAG